VQSSYAVHPNMQSHTGIVMSRGNGATYTASNKQKFITKSSTEAKLVIDNAMGQVVWTRHFAVTQVEYVSTTTVYQDNKSTILSAENGKQSSSQCTRH